MVKTMYKAAQLVAHTTLGAAVVIAGEKLW